MRVYKYQLELGLMNFEWPIESKVVLVGEQEKKMCMWVLHPDDEQIETRTFVIAGTGHEVLGKAEHVYSWQDPPFVWHLFELWPK